MQSALSTSDSVIHCAVLNIPNTPEALLVQKTFIVKKAILTYLYLLHPCSLACCHYLQPDAIYTHSLYTFICLKYQIRVCPKSFLQ